MEIYGLILFFHLLMLVFWVGTDLGVLLLAKFSQRSEYSMDQRVLLLKAALLLDIPPRICMVLALPSGVWLARSAGFIELADSTMIGILLFSLFWLTVAVMGIVKAEAPEGPRIKLVERVLLFALGLALLATGIIMASTGAAPGWLAAKIIAFGLITGSAEMIDRSFKPGIVAFQTMVQEGSTPEREETMNRSFNRTALWVYTVYGLVIFVGFMGTVKPF